MPDQPMIPFFMEVLDHLDSPTSLCETPTGLGWYLCTGTPTTRTAQEAAHELPDEALAMLLIGYSIRCTLEQARRDPIGTLGPLASALAHPEIVPRRLARRRA